MQSLGGFILIPMMTSNLGVNDFAVYSIILTFATVISSISYLGMSTSLERYYFEFKEVGKDSNLLSLGLLILLISLSLEIIIVIGYAGNISNLLLNNDNYSKEIITAVIASCINCIVTYFIMFSRVQYKSITVIVFGLLNLFLNVGFFLILDSLESKKVNVPFEAGVLSQLTVACALAFVNRTNLKIEKIEFKTVKSLILFGLSSIVASFGLMLFDQLDKQFIAQYITLKDAGLYSAAQRISIIANILIVTPVGLIWPSIAIENKDSVIFDKYYKSAVFYYAYFSSMLFCSLCIFSDVIVPVFIRFEYDKKFLEVFVILTFSSLLFGFLNISTIIFKIKNCLHKKSVIIYLVVLVKLLFLFLFSKFMGIVCFSLVSILFVTILIVLINMLGQKIRKTYFNKRKSLLPLIFAILYLITFCVGDLFVSLSLSLKVVFEAVTIILFWSVLNDLDKKIFNNLLLNFSNKFH